MKLHLLLLTCIFSISSFAGTLENRKTGETIELELLNENTELDIVSHTPNLDSKRVNLVTRTRVNGRKFVRIPSKSSGIRLFGMTEYTCEKLYGLAPDGVSLCLMIPVYNIPALIVAAANTAALPVIGTVKFIQNQKFKRDQKKLVSAMTKDEVVKVTNKRFNRIVSLLKRMR